MPRRQLVLLVGWAFALACCPEFAAAQTEPILPAPSPPVAPNVPATDSQPLGRGESILGRARPEYDALGVRIGDYFLYPRIEASEAYNDNLFAANSGTVHDFITAVTPAFDLKSNFGANSLDFSASTTISRYARNTSFDNEDAFGAATGVLDLGVAENLHGNLKVAKQHEDPGSPNVPGAIAEPVKYMTYSGAAGYENSRTRIGYSADLTAVRQEFEAVPIIGGGLLPQSDQNNFTYTATAEGNYEFAAKYRGFVRGGLDYRDYDHAALGAPIRTSHGFRVDGGVRIDLTGLLFAEAFAGYLQEDYQAASLGTVSGGDVGATVAWNVSQVTSLSFRASRSIETASASVVGTGPAPAYVESIASVNFDHELYRNLLLNGHAAYTNDDFSGIDRSDNDYLAGAGVKLLLDRRLYLGASYDFEHRDSSGGQAINPFSRNIIMLRISTQL